MLLVLPPLSDEEVRRGSTLMYVPGKMARRSCCVLRFILPMLMRSYVAAQRHTTSTQHTAIHFQRIAIAQRKACRTSQVVAIPHEIELGLRQSSGQWQGPTHRTRSRRRRSWG